ncbi:MAG TPA: DUF2460 domain-containing protein, partial [Sphingomicrobium sp.]|nr:DUF2460 domain-containing protein [Sphingomicrobium sp.]
WTVDFPRGAIASINSSSDGHGLTVEAEFLRKGDLVGLIFESVDRHAHPAHARQTSTDYSHCTLGFRWQSNGTRGLDAINGPTLTIEGRDSSGNERSWYVRLWNYAQGTATSAEIRLNFDALDGGFSLPTDADRVDPRFIDRMFISIVPPDYEENSEELRGSIAAASVTLSDISCDGSGSVLAINDAIVPDHSLRIATAYDDMYNLAPARVVEAVERLGYRKVINHYVGMSHYFGLTSSGLVDPARPLNGPALAWHRNFAKAAAERGFEAIWSLSYEILDMFCPEPWKQRAFDGSPAATGYDPPSALVSPASSPGMSFLTDVAMAFVAIAEEAGLRPQIQIGEPWWWVNSTGAICLYDESAKAAFGGDPVGIGDVRAAMTAQQMALMDSAGALLAASTAQITGAVKTASLQAVTLLLAYLPGSLDPDAPELRRANLPLGWARPAFDVLQLEDYEWVTSGRSDLRAAAYAQTDARLGYPRGEQHYMSGFVASAEQRGEWSLILDAAAQARQRGVAEVLVWALPQVLRDGLTVFGEEQPVTPFDDVLFPIEIGSEASVSPGFSTSVVTSASGHESRNVNWQQARLRYDAGPGVRGDGELETLIAFFRARRGPAIGFRFRDPYDHSSNGMSGVPSAEDQQIGEGNGAISRFPLIKSYGPGEKRRITRPHPGSVRVAVDGTELVTGWALEPFGVIQFAQAPGVGAVITAGYLFDVPVRFADDRLEVNRASFLAGEAPSVPLVEIREG